MVEYKKPDILRMFFKSFKTKFGKPLENSCYLSGVTCIIYTMYLFVYKWKTMFLLGFYFVFNQYESFKPVWLV